MLDSRRGVLKSAFELSHERIQLWRRDPVQFVRDNFQVEPDKWQVRVLRAFASADPKKQRIAMKACKGPGKTAVMAWCIWNFMGCYGEPGEHPKGKATGITEQNLDDNLWPELAKWRGRSSYLTAAFEWTKSRLYARDHKDTWFFSKQAWPKDGDQTAQANTLAGLHGKYVLFVLEESGGIPTAVLATAEAGLANAEQDGGWAKILQGGNPTHLDGALYDACTGQAHLWFVVEITGDPDDPERSPRISVVWAKQQIELYGADNPWVLVNVFGRFPPSSINALLGPDEVRAAMARHLQIDTFEWAQKRIGIDVARFGDDRTVIAFRQGLCASFMPIILRKNNTTEIAARVMKEHREFDAEVMLIDDTGHWGHGVIDNLDSAGYNTVGVQFHAPALDPRYKNRRAECWLELADWVKKGGALPNVPELIPELTKQTYTFLNGKFLLADKAIVKAEIGFSPDIGEAIALTFAIPDLPGGISKKRRALKVAGVRLPQEMDDNELEHDWDPLERMNA